MSRENYRQILLKIYHSVYSLAICFFKAVVYFFYYQFLSMNLKHYVYNLHMLFPKHPVISMVGYPNCIYELFTDKIPQHICKGRVSVHCNIFVYVYVNPWFII